jgi:hypothetical protein
MLLAYLLAESLPPGVTEATTLGAFGPTIYVFGLVIALAAGGIAMWFRARGVVYEALESKDGRAILHDAFWGEVKSEDFSRWLKVRVDDHTTGQTAQLLARMEALASSVERLTGEVERLVERLEKRDDDMRELERRFFDKTG